jgi:predicted Zn-dependent protease
MEHRDAVYLQQLTGAGVGLNAMTGRVDVGCVGALIRGGEAAGRLPTTPLSSSLPAILRAVTAVADDAYQVPFTPVSAATVVCDGGLVELTS